MGIVSYTHGKHSLKMGASLIRRQANGCNAGEYPLGLFYAGDGGAFGLPNLSVADLLLGGMLEGQRQLNLVPAQPRTWESGLFIQEKWVSHHSYNDKAKKKATKKVEKAVRKAVKKGVTENAVEKAVS